MPDVQDGLSTAPPEENVNSDAGFEAAIARKAGTTDQLEEHGSSAVSTSVKDGLEVGPPAPFAPAVADTGEGEEDTPTGDAPAGGTAQVENPELAALIEKNGGDPVAALAELNERFTNAQSLIGRQGNDLGQLRNEMAELRGMIAEQRASATAPQAVVASADDVAEWVTDQGGASVALWAAQQGDDALVERVIKEWAKQAELEGESTFEALAFRQDWKEYQREQRAAATAPAPVANEPDPWVQSKKQQEQFGGVLETLQQESSDWEQFSPHLMAALEKLPAPVLAMISSPNPAESLEGARIAADKARIIAGTVTAAGGLATQAANDAATARKTAAQVTTGSLRPAVTEQTPLNEEEASAKRVAAFKAALLSTETTSVRDGLTFGKN